MPQIAFFFTGNNQILKFIFVRNQNFAQLSFADLWKNHIDKKTVCCIAFFRILRDFQTIKNAPGIRRYPGRV